jgi:PhnB protein
MAITPYLLYQDAGAAVDWLATAFGLRKTSDVFRGEDGRVNHASMTFGKAVLMLGSPGPDFKGPRALGHATQNLYVDVDKVDEHYARAVKAGARIIEEPKDTFYGARRYGAEDLEGHCWYFAQELAVARKRAKKAPRRKRTAPKKKAKARSRNRSSRK